MVGTCTLTSRIKYLPLYLDQIGNCRSYYTFFKRNRRLEFTTSEPLTEDWEILLIGPVLCIHSVDHWLSDSQSPVSHHPVIFSRIESQDVSTIDNRITDSDYMCGDNGCLHRI